MADRNVEALINPLRFGDYAAGNYVEVGADGILKYFGTAKQSRRKAISIVALDYETADLTTGTQKYTMRMPYPMELTEVRANVRTAPAGADLVVDINQEGTSVLTTPVSIDQEVKTSGSVELTAGTDGEVSSVTVDGVVVTSGAVPYNTVNDVAATGTVTLDGIDGEVSSVSVDGVVVTNAAVPYNTVNDVAAAGTITLSGTDGNILSVLVGGVETIVTAVPFNTDLTTTAADLVTEINLNTVDYTATSALEVVTLTAVTVTGSGGNGITVVSTTDLTMVGADVDLAGGSSDISPTATDLAANITAFTSAPNYTATAALGVVTITPDLAGASTNGFVVSTVAVLSITSVDADLAGGVSDVVPTAADLAANITAFTSVPNYTATSALGVVTIVPDTAGDATNGFVVTPVTTLTLTATAVDLAGGVTEKTSTTSATPAVIGTSALADDAEITIDIDQVGSTVPGQGLKIHLIGYLV